jgi:hypothetical protein
MPCTGRVAITWAAVVGLTYDVRVTLGWVGEQAGLPRKGCLGRHVLSGSYGSAEARMGDS